MVSDAIETVMIEGFPYVPYEAYERKMSHQRQKIEALQQELEKWKRIRTPTHGPCCTCQACGLHYDDCRCDLDEVADALALAKKRIKELELHIKELNLLLIFAKEWMPQKVCPTGRSTDWSTKALAELEQWWELVSDLKEG